MRVRHAVLCTRFFDDGEGAMLEVLDPADVERFALLEQLDVSALSGAEQERADADFHVRITLRPFDIGRGDVISVALTRWSTTRHRLTVSLHNIVSDAESVTIYVNELCELWRALTEQPDRDPHAILPAVRIQYHELAQYLERLRESETGQAQRAFWTKQLDGLDPLQLPVDMPRDPVDARRDANGGIVAFPARSAERALMADDLSALKRIADSQNASIMSALVAGMAGYLSQRTSQRDLTLITRLSHRYVPRLRRTRGLVVNPARLRHTLGFLVNSIALRVSTEGAPTFAELVARTDAVVNDAVDHGECDLLDLAPSGAFRFCLVYVRTPASSTPAPPMPPGCVATRAPHPGAGAGTQTGYDLMLWLHHLDDRIQMYLLFNCELFHEATAAALLAGYCDYLAAACRS